jgi:hypothetical protein
MMPFKIRGRNSKRTPMSMTGRLRRVADRTLQSLVDEPERIADFLDEEGFADLDIDKAWHAIHFLLTGTAWEGDPPLDFLVRGGIPIGDVEIGYGPARAFTSTQVGAISSALQSFSVTQLRANYDPERMRTLEIYPHGWESASADHLDDYFLFYADELRRFLDGAVKEGEGLLVYLT